MGMKVTRPVRSLSMTSSRRDAVSSVSTTTWNKLEKCEKGSVICLEFNEPVAGCELDGGVVFLVWDIEETVEWAVDAFEAESCGNFVDGLETTASILNVQSI